MLRERNINFRFIMILIYLEYSIMYLTPLTLDNLGGMCGIFDRLESV